MTVVGVRPLATSRRALSAEREVTTVVRSLIFARSRAMDWLVLSRLGAGVVAWLVGCWIGVAASA